ncbi:MAG: radical SAM protein [Proteobacteria bacterium]|nr:radical SAM protein [Pseudomonadota bacterium]
MNLIASIKECIQAGHPVTVEQAKELYESATDDEIQALSLIAKARFHKLDEATYLIMSIVNYTNICVAKCSYCSFYRLPHDKEGYLLSEDDVSRKVSELKSLGGTLVGFNGGFHPKLRIEDYAKLFRGIRTRFPTLEFYEMTVAEFMFSCKVSRITYAEGARILKDSGTKWVTGGGAEILNDSFRKRHSPGKYSVKDYFDAQKEILDCGLGSTATMVIGFDESIDERFDHLNVLRDFQSMNHNNLASFLCWTYKPYNNELGGAEIPTIEYLRWLGICRIFLHNFRNIRTSVLTKNTDALIALKYGANDFDLPTEDEVTQKAGASISREFDAILKVASDLGFKVRHRSPWPTRIQ